MEPEAPPVYAELQAVQAGSEERHPVDGVGVWLDKVAGLDDNEDYGIDL